MIKGVVSELKARKNQKIIDKPNAMRYIIHIKHIGYICNTNLGGKALW